MNIVNCLVKGFMLGCLCGLAILLTTTPALGQAWTTAGSGGPSSSSGTFTGICGGYSHFDGFVCYDGPVSPFQVADDLEALGSCPEGCFLEYVAVFDWTIEVGRNDNGERCFKARMRVSCKYSADHGRSIVGGEGGH